MRNTRRIAANAGIVLRNRSIVPRLMKNYASLATGNTVLRTLEIAVTYDCQCTCRHCSSEGLRDAAKTELADAEVKNLIDSCISHGAVHILFTGGETLIPREKLLELIRYADSKGCITSIDTNGVLLDKGYAADLKDAGLDVACISIDSMDPTAHDTNRGVEGCHKHAVRAVRNCRDNGIQVIISALVTKAGLRDNSLYRILDFAEKNDSSVIFCLPVMTGRWHGNKSEKLDSSDFKELEKLMEHPLARLCEENNYFFKGCAAGSEKMTVSLYGDVMPCSFIKEKYGNVRDDDLGTILARMRQKPGYSCVNRGTRCLAAQGR